LRSLTSRLITFGKTLDNPDLQLQLQLTQPPFRPARPWHRPASAKSRVEPHVHVHTTSSAQPRQRCQGSIQIPVRHLTSPHLTSHIIALLSSLPPFLPWHRPGSRSEPVDRLPPVCPVSSHRTLTGPDLRSQSKSKQVQIKARLRCFVEHRLANRPAANCHCNSLEAVKVINTSPSVIHP
jgi:hypothetical protein